MNNNNKEKLISMIEEKEEEIKANKLADEALRKPKDIEPKKTGLKSQIDDLNDKLSMILGKESKKIKKKSFKLPFGVKKELKKLAKKNKVQVLLLQENKNIKPTIGEIKEGMLFVGDKIHDGSADIVWLWNGKFPTTIVKEWDLKPLTPTQLYEETLRDKSIAYPQTIMIRAMELKEVLQKGSKLSGKMLIWLLIGGVIVFYVLFGPGGG